MHKCSTEKGNSFFVLKKHNYSQQCKRWMDPIITSAEKQHYRIEEREREQDFRCPRTWYYRTKDITHVVLAPTLEVLINNPALLKPLTTHLVIDSAAAKSYRWWSNRKANRYSQNLMYRTYIVVTLYFLHANFYGWDCLDHECLLIYFRFLYTCMLH